MLRQIRGTIATVEEHAIVVDVGGIGYYIYTSEPQQHYTVGSEILLHTHLAVRENALDLYGFTDRDTLDVFELLTTLPKIGPKTALQFLRQADIHLLKEAVRNNDASYLSKMSGIGKKSAEKIVLGLKDKFDFDDINTDVSTYSAEGAGAVYARDTVDALIALGYPQEDARRALRHVEQEHPDTATSADALKLALKHLSS